MTASNAARTWSRQQDAIFSWFESNLNVPHLIVRARAGTGKTTTILEGVRRAPEASKLLCAFNARIKDELNSRLSGIAGAEAKTLHAVGFSCCRRFRERLVIEDARRVDVLRRDALARQACGLRAPDPILKMVAKLHTIAREVAPHAEKPGDLLDLAIRFECEPDEAWTRAGFGVDYVEQKALECMTLAADVKSGDVIDFSDMIFLPCRNGWLVKQYDLVVVDEAQDMTTAQLEVALGVLNDGGRVCVVGDDRQAIYGFRGADSESLDRLKAQLNADELGLTVTYRCGRAIVDVARGYVPDFEAGPDNPAGIISYVGDDPQDGGLTKQAGPGDFILSRVNAPLVSIAMQLLRSGKRARVAGKDIGKGLVALLRKLKARSVPELLQRISGWEAREVQRLQAQMAGLSNGRKEAAKAKVEAIKDQAEMLVALADGAKNVDEVMARAEALFTDDGLGQAGVITCSSVHKAKGLEAERVFILASTLRQGTREEENICYVAVTRAKRELTWVGSMKEEQR